MNPHVEKLIADINSLDLYDLTIECQDGKVNTHSYLLKTRSPHLASMLATKGIDFKIFSKAAVILVIDYITKAKIPDQYHQIGILIECWQLSSLAHITELETETLILISERAKICFYAVEILNYVVNEYISNICLETITATIILKNGDGKTDYQNIDAGTKWLILAHLIRIRNQVAIKEGVAPIKKIDKSTIDLILRYLFDAGGICTKEQKIDYLEIGKNIDRLILKYIELVGKNTC